MRLALSHRHLHWITEILGYEKNGMRRLPMDAIDNSKKSWRRCRCAWRGISNSLRSSSNCERRRPELQQALNYFQA
jgi:hypothetical protein